ncbi:PD-(D/E)XK nuclease superfamily protein [compost metagenome]
MKLSIEQVIDYQRCPLLYKFRHIDDVDVRLNGGPYRTPNQKYVAEYFDYAMHNVVYGIFHQFADGRYPNAYYVKKRWGQLWNAGRTKEDIIIDTGSWRNDLRKREKQGLDSLLSVHSDFQSNPGTPILIGKGYSIPVGNHELVGTIEMVREVDGIIELMDFKTDDRPIALHVKGDMAVTAASLAFRKLFGYKEERIAYYGLLSRKTQYTQRDKRDFALLERTVDNVARGIESGIIYPVMNSRCQECPFQKHCEKREWFE